MFELTITKSFAAAHKLQLVAKKCENLHGHNWKVEVSIMGEKLNEAGVLIDFGILKEALSKIIETLDHKYLNEIEDFKIKPPSSEVIAFYISNKMADYLKKYETLKVSKVIVWESDNACATYFPHKKSLC